MPDMNSAKKETAKYEGLFGGLMPAFPVFNERIRNNMRTASQACYHNGNDLLVEANILYDNKCYARATSLAILAEEEFSKEVDPKGWTA
jgi:hypothetical protein